MLQEKKTCIRCYETPEGEEILLATLDRWNRHISWAVTLNKLLNFSYLHFWGEGLENRDNSSTYFTELLRGLNETFTNTDDQIPCHSLCV